MSDKCLIESGLTPEEQKEFFGDAEITPEAQIMAAKSALSESANRARQAKFRELRKSQAYADVLDYIDRVGEDSPKIRKQALESLLVRDLRDRGDTTNVAAMGNAINAEAQAKLAMMAEDIRPKRLGIKRERELMNDVSDELHGTSTGNAKAKAYADAIAEVFEDMRARFNRAGGNIAKLEDWGLPHATLAGRLPTTAGEYVENTIPLLNRDRMLNGMGEPMSDQQLREMLTRVYHNIMTENQMAPLPSQVGDYKAGKAVANRHQQHRELHFRNGPAYRQYADMYGNPNYWQTITNSIESHSREIAMIERLGPNPENTYQVLKNTLNPDKGFAIETDAIFRNLMGIQRPDHNTFLGKASLVGSATRSLLSAAQLGSAVLSSVTDVGTAAINASFNGLGWTRMLSRLSSINTAESRAFAARLGGSLEYALDNVGISNRYDDVVNTNIGQRPADVVFRASGLSAWTNMLRRAHFMEMAYSFGANRALKFDDLEPRFKSMLESYGISDADWSVIRKASTKQKNGEQYMDFLSIDDVDLRSKALAIVHQEMDLAVLMPDARSRAIVNRGQAEDTLAGWLGRSIGQYKQFPITMFLNNTFRYLASNRLDLTSRIGYSAALLITTTLLGGLAIQLKDISKGKTPRPMDTDEFWKAAWAQGGGAGIVGDYFYSGFVDGRNRFGQPAWVTLTGPTGGLAYDAGSTVKNIAESLYEGEGVDLSRATRYVPGNSLWFARLAYERYLTDQLGQLTDRDYKARKQKQERKLRSETGQEYYWRPTEAAPEGL